MRIIAKGGLVNDVRILDKDGKNILQDLKVKEINIRLVAGEVIKAEMTCFLDGFDFTKMEILKYKLIDVERNETQIFKKLNE